MASIQVDEKSAMETNDKNVSGSNSIQSAQERTNTVSPDQGAEPNRPWWHPIIEPGHAVQIIIAAVVAIAIGLGVTAAVGKDNIPEAAPAILGIPGQLWLRALQAVGELPLGPSPRPISWSTHSDHVHCKSSL